MSKFTSFFKIYVPEQYRALWSEIGAAYRALYGRQNSEGWNRWTLYDHGLLFRLLRDLVLLITTAFRLGFGLVSLALLTAALPVAAVLRAVAIPIFGVVKGLNLARKIKGSLNDKT